MTRNRLEDADFRRLSVELDVPEAEIKRAVGSFFGEIIRESRTLPFSNDRKIYTKEAFDRLNKVWNIPFIGRIGTSYSRYLKWRVNESKNIVQEKRSAYRKRMTQDEVEHIAEEILAGRTPPPIQKHKGSELFNRVWIVGTEGKKQARQVIPKKKKNGI